MWQFITQQFAMSQSGISVSWLFISVLLVAANVRLWLRFGKKSGS